MHGPLQRPLDPLACLLPNPEINWTVKQAGWRPLQTKCRRLPSLGLPGGCSRAPRGAYAAVQALYSRPCALELPAAWADLFVTGTRLTRLPTPSAGDWATPWPMEAPPAVQQGRGRSPPSARTPAPAVEAGAASSCLCQAQHPSWRHPISPAAAAAAGRQQRRQRRQRRLPPCGRARRPGTPILSSARWGQAGAIGAGLWPGLWTAFAAGAIHQSCWGTPGPSHWLMPAPAAPLCFARAIPPPPRHTAGAGTGDI